MWTKWAAWPRAGLLWQLEAWEVGAWVCEWMAGCALTRNQNRQSGVAQRGQPGWLLLVLLAMSPQVALPLSSYVHVGMDGMALNNPLF